MYLSNWQLPDELRAISGRSAVEAKARQHNRMFNIVRAVVTTFRPSKSDNVPPEILKPIRRKFSYGVRVYADGKEVGFASSWAPTKDAQYCEMLGVSGLLDALEERDDLPSLEIILNSAQLDVRFRHVETRLRKKQRDRPVSPIKKERQWEGTTLRLQRFKKGIREAFTDSETEEVGKIKAHLKAEFYSGERFSSATPPDFRLILPDV